jgi:phosphoglycolate phosphatase-like HAD superfamily hydrolase
MIEERVRTLCEQMDLAARGILNQVGGTFPFVGVITRLNQLSAAATELAQLRKDHYSEADPLISTHNLGTAFDAICAADRRGCKENRKDVMESAASANAVMCSLGSFLRPKPE